MQILWSEFWHHNFVETVSVVQHEKGIRCVLWIISVEEQASAHCRDCWGDGADERQVVLGHCENKCERPFGILLFGSVVQVPPKFCHLLGNVQQRDTSLRQRLLKGWKMLHSWIVSLSWRLVTSDVWMVAIAVKNSLEVQNRGVGALCSLFFPGKGSVFMSCGTLSKT